MFTARRRAAAVAVGIVALVGGGIGIYIYVLTKQASPSPRSPREMEILDALFSPEPHVVAEAIAEGLTALKDSAARQILRRRVQECLQSRTPVILRAAIIASVHSDADIRLVDSAKGLAQVTSAIKEYNKMVSYEQIELQEENGELLLLFTMWSDCR